MVKYISEKEARKAKLEPVKCKECAKMLAEAKGIVSKICPNCGHVNIVEVT